MKLENLYSNTAEKAREQAEDVVAGAQDRVEKASEWVAHQKTPVRKITSASLKLSAISHRTADKLIKQQEKAIEREFDALAAYLRTLASSHDVRSFVREQANVLPRVTQRMVENSRQTFSILRDAGSDINGLARSTVTEFRPTTSRKPATRKTAKTAATKTKKKTARKTTSRRKTAAKVA